MKKIFTLLLFVFALSFAMAQVPNHVVISQVYGGGGNSGAVYKNDFIELFNPTATAVDLSTWSVQYASATGTSWQLTPLTGSIPAYSFYLIQQAQGSGGSTDLPTPNVIGAIAMSGTAGKVALVNNQTALSGACPTGAMIVDFVGWGTANCHEGAAAAPATTNTTAAIRKFVNGLPVDTNDNGADFETGSANPRNSSVMPIDLLSFSAIVSEGTVSVRWTTTNEVNVLKFDIEKSINARDFRVIGTVEARNSVATNNYSFVDEQLVAGVSYYRLKMVDKDGSFKYSPIATVRTKSTGINIYPNPVRSVITLQHEAATRGAMISVMTVAGKQVMNVNIQTGAEQTTIDASRLAPGTYMIVYMNNGERITRQFIKE